MGKRIEKPSEGDSKTVERTEQLLRRKGLTPATVPVFRDIICKYYREQGRALSWRNTKDPYRILVSEIMLQQTQVERVTQKYDRFIKVFPDFPSLARAPFRRILEEWQGMGYNRRARALHETAKIVMDECNGVLPSSTDELQTLPGIGKASASAICAFAFDQPTVFIETNIRRVFIHFFFADKSGVKDSEILPLVEKALDVSNPREWYYALMDYGVMLKKATPNPNRKSAHYKRQSSFEGSDRQIRGMILKALIATPKMSKAALIRQLEKDPDRVTQILLQLEKEGFIKRVGRSYTLA